MNVRNLLCASAAMAPWTIGAPAWGADEPQKSVLEEIIVTAQKRSESVQDVPASITAVSAEQLQSRGLTEPGDLQFLVPSMTAGTLRGDTAIAIRGVGLNKGSPAVAIHIDGVFQPRPTMGDLTQIDIERVEVLRGPQGTIYGRNANGGVVNYITRSPTDEFGGYVLGSYESYNETRVQGSLNMPVSDRLRARLTVDQWERADGFVENVRSGGQQVDRGKSLFGRFYLAADVTDNLTASLIANAATRSGPFVYVTNTNPPTASVIAANPFFANAIVPLQPRQTAQNDPADTDRHYSSLAGILNWKIGDFDVRSITAYQRFRNNFTGDFDATDISAAAITQNTLSKTFTQELNVSGSMGPLKMVTGVFYMDDDFYSTIDFVFSQGVKPALLPAPGSLPPGSGFHSENNPYNAKTAAVFGDGTWNITENFRLIGGLRYSKDKQQTTQNSYLSAAGFIIPPTVCKATSEVEFTSTTPRAGLQYDVSSDSNLYATFSKGFKIGGFNYQSGCGAGFGPEKLTSYEIGWKNRLLGGALTLNASAFYYDYTDLQVARLVDLAFVTANAPKAEVYGLELESVARPDGHWTLNANLSLMNAQFKEFTNVDALNTSVGYQDLNGNPLPNAPSFTLNAGAAYRTDPILADGSLTLRVDVSYKSRIQFREFDNPKDSQAGYALLNASIAWDSSSEKYNVRVYGKNLTDRDYYAQLAQSDFTGARFVSWGAPQQFGVEFKAKF